ncbi:hypothetical protein JTE90_029697 [Oedothorax gibbosus]|uniref:Ig-like domain-containing protein n=1 Tax=Oedothorax gibbosus TaxID=931172 RepID=A0AAV6UKS1_9ARAC|nr:hypothetical protein JTE90_029697 [Oedothorax gibbosus]
MVFKKVLKIPLSTKFYFLIILTSTDCQDITNFLKSLPPSATSLGVWKRLLPDTATFVPVSFDGQRTRLLSDLSLELSDVREEDSGIYFCSQGTQVMAKYAVDVVRDEPHRYIIMGGRKKKNGPSKDLTLKDKNLVLGITWSEWSQCNRCDSVGRRRRVGICTVRKIDPFAPTKPVDTQVLNEYRKGIPCRSSLLPNVIKDLAVVHELKSEFMIGFCKVPCPLGVGIVTVTDKDGAVLDTVDNSQGVYSMHQPLPKLPALVKRATVYEEIGKNVILSCPGNKENSFPIWRNDSYVINPSKVHILSNGRVKIDIGNNLHIRKLRYSDTAVYSCWENSALRGTIRLQVLKKSVESYRVHILNIGTLFTFLTILMIALTVYKNRGIAKD